MKKTNTTEAIALVTGVGRRESLGYAVCRDLARIGHKVFLTARDKIRGAALADELSKEGLPVEFLQLDVEEMSSLEDANAYLEKKYGKLDVLVNNAGGYYDYDKKAANLAVEELEGALSLNLRGAVNSCLVFIPLMRKSTSPRIVNVSSQVASLNAPWGIRDGSNPSYAISKAALNAFTFKLADHLRKEKFLVNAVCPGWIATYPGMAEMGARPVEQGSKSVLWACTLPAKGPTGGFYRDGAKLDW